MATYTIHLQTLNWGRSAKRPRNRKATLLVPTIAGPRHARTEHHTIATAPAPVLLLPHPARLLPPLPTPLRVFKNQNPSRNSETPSTIARRKRSSGCGFSLRRSHRSPPSPYPVRKAGLASRSSAPSPSLATGVPSSLVRQSTSSAHPFSPDRSLLLAKRTILTSLPRARLASRKFPAFHPGTLPPPRFAASLLASVGRSAKRTARESRFLLLNLPFRVAVVGGLVCDCGGAGVAVCVKRGIRDSCGFCSTFRLLLILSPVRRHKRRCGESIRRCPALEGPGPSMELAAPVPRPGPELKCSARRFLPATLTLLVPTVAVPCLVPAPH